MENQKSDLNDHSINTIINVLKLIGKEKAEEF